MRTVTGRARLISRIEVEARAFANADYTTRDLSYGRASWGCSTQARSSATGRELQRPELATGSPTGHPEDGPPDAQATLTPAAHLFAAWERGEVPPRFERGEHAPARHVRAHGLSHAKPGDLMLASALCRHGLSLFRTLRNVQI